MHQALALERLDRQRSATNASAGVARAGQDKASAAAQSRAVELRDQAYDALRDAAGRDEALHRSHDPTIPRLVPISTWRLFNRNTRKKAGEGEAAPAGSDAPAAAEGAELGGG